MWSCGYLRVGLEQMDVFSLEANNFSFRPLHSIARIRHALGGRTVTPAGCA
jgi:hypothetical protein